MSDLDEIMLLEGMVASRDEEIERLRAEVERLKVSERSAWNAAVTRDEQLEAERQRTRLPDELVAKMDEAVADTYYADSPNLYSAWSAIKTALAGGRDE